MKLPTLNIPKFKLNINKPGLPKLPNLFKKKNKFSAGIEVDTDFCRVAILEDTQEGIIPALIPFEFEIPSSDDLQAGLILKDEMNRRGIELKNAAFCIPTSMVLYKTVTLPKAEEKELIEAVDWNIQEDIKDIRQNIVYDFVVLSDSKDTVNVIVSIVKKDIVNRILSISEAANLNVDFIDSSATALLNIALVQKDKVEAFKSESNICIVHIDKHDSYILFSNNNIIIQPVDFKITDYDLMSPDEKESSIIRLVNEINYFFLTITEPRIIYTSGYFFTHPEIKAYMQLKFGHRFSLEDLDCIISFDINYSGNYPIQLYNSCIAVAYRGLIE